MNWHKANTVDLITSIKVCSSNYLLNIAAFSLACKKAKITNPDISDKSSVQGKFFSALLVITDKNMKFNEQDLVMCALALAKGTPREKAMELFQYFDKDCNGNLDRQEIENMFIEYARFVAVILPIIGAGDPRDDLLHPETIQWYQRGMARNMNHVIVALVHKVLRHPGQERIDHDSFVELMCEDENAKILSSSGLRQFVLKEGGFKRRESKNIYYKELDRKMERVLAITGQAFDMPDCAPPRKKGKRA